MSIRTASALLANRCLCVTLEDWSLSVCARCEGVLVLDLPCPLLAVLCALCAVESGSVTRIRNGTWDVCALFEEQVLYFIFWYLTRTSQHISSR